jgi:exonuclease SbcC
MRVDLALRIALSVLLASRAGARCEMLVLDETCAPLDAQGRALFVDCLGRISDRFATVLVVTHVDELKELFPYRYEVSKNGQGSMVNLVAA